METWGRQGGSSASARAVFDGRGAGTNTNSLFEYSLAGNPALTGSVLQGLHLTDSHLAVRIALPATAHEQSVSILDNLIDEVAVGVEAIDAFQSVSSHVIAYNELEGPGVNYPSFLTRGIQTSGADCYPWIHANSVSCFQYNVECTLGRPHISSNFIQLGHINVDIYGGVLSNNTIAFALFQQLIPEVVGVQHCTTQDDPLVLSNNILWNPASGSGSNMAIDLRTRSSCSSTGTVINLLTNCIEDGGGIPGCVPNFVGGNAHPGDCSPADLHLGTSALIGAGVSSLIANTSGGGNPILVDQFAGYDLRTDVNTDIDGEPRIYRSSTESGFGTVDVGADEVAEFGLSLSGSFVDDLGNVRPSAQVPDPNGGFIYSYAFDVNLTGPAGSTATLLSSTGFFDSGLSAGNVLVPNTWIRQNLLTPAGTTLLDVSNQLLISTLASSAAMPAGNVTVPVQLSGIFEPNVEAELVLQAVYLTPDSRLVQGARQKVELNR